MIRSTAAAAAAASHLLLIVTLSSAYTAPLNKGLEIRVCQDKDCLLDGSKETLSLVKQAIAPDTDGNGQPITVKSCGCLGPCGSGPTVDVRQDGLRVKDTREGQDDYFIFRKIDSAKAVGDMLTIAGIGDPLQLPLQEDSSSMSMSDNGKSVTRTRQWHGLDRNQRIVVQRILYAITALLLWNAHLNGTWDEIGGNGVVVPNSYYGIAAAVFVASQFMGTSQRSNAVPTEIEQ